MEEKKEKIDLSSLFLEEEKSNVREPDKEVLEISSETSQEVSDDIESANYHLDRSEFPEMAPITKNNGKKSKTKYSLKEKDMDLKYGMASDTHPLTIKARERAGEVFELRKQGWTLRQIAHKFEVSPRVISQIIKREVKKVTSVAKENIEDMRQIQQERLDFMLRSVWDNMASGHTRSIEIGLQIMERQAKLMGLDAPERKEISITVEMTDEELIRNAASLGIPIPAELDTSAGPVVTAEYTIKEPDKLEDKRVSDEGQTREAGPSSSENKEKEV